MKLIIYRQTLIKKWSKICNQKIINIVNKYFTKKYFYWITNFYDWTQPWWQHHINIWICYYSHFFSLICHNVNKNINSIHKVVSVYSTVCAIISRKEIQIYQLLMKCVGSQERQYKINRKILSDKKLHIYNVIPYYM